MTTTVNDKKGKKEVETESEYETEEEEDEEESIQQKPKLTNNIKSSDDDEEESDEESESEEVVLEKKVNDKIKDNNKSEDEDDEEEEEEEEEDENEDYEEEEIENNKNVKNDTDSSTEFMKDQKLYNEKEYYNSTLNKLEIANTNNINKQNDNNIFDLGEESVNINFNNIVKDLKQQTNKATNNKEDEYLNKLIDLEIDGLEKDKLLDMLMKPEETETTKKKINLDRLTNTTSLNNLTLLYNNQQTINNSQNKNINNLLIQDSEIKDIKQVKNNIIKQFFDNKQVENQIQSDAMQLLISDEDILNYKNNNFDKTKFTDKIKNYQDKRKEKLEKLKREVYEQKNKECTFIPQQRPMSPGLNNNQRKLNDFLEDQEKYIKKIQEKKNILKAEKEKQEEEKFKKPITKNTKYKQMLNEKIGPSEERLYKKQNPIDKVLKVETKQGIGTSNNNKTKKVTEKELKEITSNLYDRAVNKKKATPSTTLNPKQHDIKNIINNSNKVLFEKFNNKFKDCVENLAQEGIIDREDYFENKEIKLNLISFHKILEACGFTKLELNNILNPSFNSPEKDEVKQLLVIVNYNSSPVMNEEENLHDVNIKLNNLFLVLLAILSLYEYYVIKEVSVNINLDIDTYFILSREHSSKICKKKNNYGFTQEENIVIPFNQTKQFIKDFTNLLFNYKNSTINTKKKVVNTNTINQKETVNKSKQAKTIIKPRQKNEADDIISYDKILQDYDKLYTVDDLIDDTSKKTNLTSSVIVKDKYDIQVLKKKNKDKFNEQLKEKLEIDKEKEHCTFKPQINQKSNEIIASKEISMEDRLDLMYNNGVKHLQQKKDKTTEEIEYEKYKNEYTFKPNINDYNKLNMNQQLINNVNDNIVNHEKHNLLIDKFAERLKRGREEREIKEKATQRFASPENISKPMNFSNQQNNLTQNVLNKTNNKSNNDDKIPFLVIDVNLDQNSKKEKKQILVFEGNNASDLAKEFALKNSK